MSKEDAMVGYVDQMKLVWFLLCFFFFLVIFYKCMLNEHGLDLQILEGMPITDEVEELLHVLGPFYELVDEKKKISQISDLSTGRVDASSFYFMGSETVSRA